MSLATLKKKTSVKYQASISGRTHTGQWVTQGPFGRNKFVLQNTSGRINTSNGFSLNGSSRNKGYIGKHYSFSKSGTPFKGTIPTGNGGKYGSYVNAEPVYNINVVNTQGNEYLYVKPSVLSNNGMIKKKFRWIHSGQYPNYWVQPIGSGNQSDTYGQSVYIKQKRINNVCHMIDDKKIYLDKPICHGKCIVKEPYTKFINKILSYDEYLSHLQKGCSSSNEKNIQCFPFQVQTGKKSCIPYGPVYVAPP